MGELDGATAVITGGSRGIGFAAARGIGLLGATVVLVGQDADRAEAAAESLQAEGIDAKAIVARLVKETIDEQAG